MSDPKRYIGCCGAYCKTCKPYLTGHCKGCKLGFDTGERDINKAKCKIKLCCFRDHELATCADCAELDACKTMADWYGKSGCKYKRYKAAIEFIRRHGYGEFLRQAEPWTGAYGRLD